VRAVKLAVPNFLRGLAIFSLVTYPSLLAGGICGRNLNRAPDVTASRFGRGCRIQARSPNLSRSFFVRYRLLKRRQLMLCHISRPGPDGTQRTTIGTGECLPGRMHLGGHHGAQRASSASASGAAVLLGLDGEHAHLEGLK
jgi:hypothetical protein